MRRACALLAAVSLTLLTGQAVAANTYVELLKERLPARVAERNDPAPEFAAEKAEFGASRRARWFGA